MLILVTGGAASGKSEHAERLVCEKAQSRLYLATMQPFGAAAETRIARHRALRRDKGFETVERPLGLAGLEPEDCWFAGDDVECDVEGAARSGLYPIWFKCPLKCTYKPECPHPPRCEHLKVSSWAELGEILRHCE